MIDSARIFYEMLEQLYAQDNMEEVEHFLIREASKSQSCKGNCDVAIAATGELGIFYRRTGNYQLAVNWFNKYRYIISDSLGENTATYAETLGNLADAYRLAGEQDKAEPLFLQALQICEKTTLTQTAFYASMLGSLSQLYGTLGDYKTALAYGEKSLQIFRPLTGVSQETASAYGNIADLYEQLGRPEEAAEARQRSAEILMFLR